MILLTEMGGQQFDTPHGRPIAEAQGRGLEVLKDRRGCELRSRQRPTTAGGIGQGGYLVARQIALEPVIDGLGAHTG